MLGAPKYLYRKPFSGLRVYNILRKSTPSLLTLGFPVSGIYRSVFGGLHNWKRADGCIAPRKSNLWHRLSAESRVQVLGVWLSFLRFQV